MMFILNKKNSMRKISFSMIVCLAAIILLFAACSDKYCGIDPPKDLKPIDWTNYNDVPTVFWNYYTFCSKTKKEDELKEILVSGYISRGKFKHDLFLVEDVSKINDGNSTDKGNIAIYPRNIELQNKVDTSDRTKKCYVKGKLTFNCHHVMSRVCESTSRPRISIANADDIYFQ